MLSDNVEAEDSEFLFDIDCEEKELNLSMEDIASEALYFKSKGGNAKNPLFKLDENTEQEAEGELNVILLRTDKYACSAISRAPTVSKLSRSMKNVSVGENSWRHEGAMLESGYLAGTSSGNRAVNDQLPGSISFVKLADMDEEEWVQYLENFQKLLCPGFAKRKSVGVGHRQRGWELHASLRS